MSHTTKSWVISNEKNRYTDVCIKQFEHGSTQIVVSTYLKASLSEHFMLASQTDFTIQELLTFYQHLPEIIDVALPSPTLKIRHPFTPLDENSIHDIPQIYSMDFS